MLPFITFIKRERKKKGMIKRIKDFFFEGGVGSRKRIILVREKRDGFGSQEMGGKLDKREIDMGLFGFDECVCVARKKWSLHTSPNPFFFFSGSPATPLSFAVAKKDG